MEIVKYCKSLHFCIMTNNRIWSISLSKFIPNTKNSQNLRSFEHAVFSFECSKKLNICPTLTFYDLINCLLMLAKYYLFIKKIPELIFLLKFSDKFSKLTHPGSAPMVIC